MQNNNKVQFLIPSYINKFTYTGSTCKDNGCYGWRISIDKATYKK